MAVPSDNDGVLADGSLSKLRSKKCCGQHILKRLFKDLGFKPSPGAKPEYAIKKVQCADAIVNGTLDVLQESDEELLITDYKTGQPLKSLNLKSGQPAIKAWKHKLQLIYYALLVGLEPHLENKAVSSQMLYVEAKTKAELTRQYSPSADEITRMASLIGAVWQHIMELNFPVTKLYSQDIRGIEAFESDLLSGKI